MLCSLHYPLPAMAAVQTGNSFLARGLRELAAWRKARLADLPAFIWVDTAPQVKACSSAGVLMGLPAL
jgi:hypothetical protein